jgi:hypothetical protein
LATAEHVLLLNTNHFTLDLDKREIISAISLQKLSNFLHNSYDTEFTHFYKAIKIWKIRKISRRTGAEKPEAHLM